MDGLTILITVLIVCITVVCIVGLFIFRAIKSEENERRITIEEEKTRRSQNATHRADVNAQLEAMAMGYYPPQQQQTPQDDGIGSLMQYLPMLLPLLQNKQQGGTAQAETFPAPDGTVKQS